MNFYSANFNHTNFRWTNDGILFVINFEKFKKNKDTFENRKDKSKRTFEDHFTHERGRERKNARARAYVCRTTHTHTRGGTRFVSSDRSWLINLLRGHKFDAVNSDRFSYTWHPRRRMCTGYMLSRACTCSTLSLTDAEKRSSLSYTPCLAPYVTPIR